MNRGKGEGALYQRARDGYWGAVVELPADPMTGARRRKAIFKRTKTEAIRAMRELHKQKAERGDIRSDRTRVDVWLRYWLNDIAAPRLRPKTVEGHRAVMEGYIIPVLGKRVLTAVTPEDVELLRKVMLKTPKDPKLRLLDDPPVGTVMLSSTYARLAHNVLSGALKEARKRGKISANPCDVADKPVAIRKEANALTAPQVIDLLQRLVLHPDGPLWATFLLTGARRGEVLGLEVDRVTTHLDLSWQLQRITNIDNHPANWEYRPLGGTLYLSRPKSAAGTRIVPIVSILRPFLDQQIGDRTSGLVFQRADGRPWDPDTASKAWKRMLADMGVPTNVVLHGSRHTVVDLLYAAGVPEHVIQQIIGHSSRAMTRGYQSAEYQPALTAGMDAFAKSLEGPSR